MSVGKSLSDKGWIILTVVPLAAIIMATILAYGALTSAAPLEVQNTESTQVAEQHTLTVVGVGTVKIRPDVAMIYLGVETRAPEASEAAQKNAAIMSAVIDELTSLGIEERDLRTAYLAIYPDIKCDSNGCVQVGYVATNTIEVSLRGDKMILASSVIDRAVKAGANLVSGVTFTLSDELQEEISDQALSKAIADAQAKAKKVTEPLGLKILGVDSVSLMWQSMPIPYPLRGEAVSTIDKGMAVFPGESTYTVQVQIVYIIG
ncbi:MAG: SIMPL domain-containing protein [Nitrososphaerota archaeon]